MSNIKSTKDGLVEKSSGKKIVSPLDNTLLSLSNKETLNVLKAIIATVKKEFPNTADATLSTILRIQVTVAG